MHPHPPFGAVCLQVEAADVLRIILIINKNSGNFEEYFTKLLVYGLLF